MNAGKETFNDALGRKVKGKNLENLRDGVLFYGDNLYVMREHFPDESVGLCYIDPPFNSNRNYNQIYNNIGAEDRAQSDVFVDTWEWNTRTQDEFNEICFSDNRKVTLQTSERKG